MGRKSKDKYKKYTEDTLKKAIEMVKGGASFGQVSKQMGIPKSTLRDYVHGKSDVGKKSGRPLSLPKEVEDDIVKKILLASESGFPLTKRQMLSKVATCVKTLGLQTQFRDGIPGNDFWRGLKQRHPELVIRKPEGCNSIRLSMLNEQVVGNYFKTLGELLEKLGLQELPKLIWNCDETNVMFTPDQARVITPKNKRNTVARTSNTRESITVLATVNAAGDTMPPLCVVKGKTMKSVESFATHDAPEGTHWTHQDNAYMTDELGAQWFQSVFLRHCGPQRPQLLVLDSHSSHEVLELLWMAKEEQIEILALPPHTTSKLQPLDVGIFGPLKSEYKQVCTEFMTEKITNQINKVTWPGLFAKAWNKVMRPDLISKAFKATGIYPFNPHVLPKEVFLPSKPTEKPLPENDDSDQTQTISTDIVQEAMEISGVFEFELDFDVPLDTEIIPVEGLMNIPPVPSTDEYPALDAVPVNDAQGLCALNNAQQCVNDVFSFQGEASTSGQKKKTNPRKITGSRILTSEEVIQKKERERTEKEQKEAEKKRRKVAAAEARERRASAKKTPNKKPNSSGDEQSAEKMAI